MHILLIEDDPLVASGIIAGLRIHALTVDHVNCARTAEAALQTGNFDLVILDLGLPDKDGMTLLRQWRKAGHSLPVLILTARDAIEDRVAGLRAGADDYLLKPFDLDELVARLHALQRCLVGCCVVLVVFGLLFFVLVCCVVWFFGVSVVF